MIKFFLGLLCGSMIILFLFAIWTLIIDFKDETPD